MLEFTHIGDLTSEEVDRIRAVYQPLAESVRDLIDATIRTEVDADEVAAAKAEQLRVRGALYHRGRPDGPG